MNENILRYAPIFWFHADESYFPIEIAALAEHADLYKDGVKLPYNRKLEDLVNLDNNGKDTWLELANINLQISKDGENDIQSKRGYGITYTSEAIKDLYTNLAKHYKPVIYARQKSFEIHESEFSDDAFSGMLNVYKDKLIGKYEVYQYFPFYIFNDFTNLHIGDWDSTVELFNNTTSNISWIRTHSHNFYWFTKMERSNHFRNINRWLDRWNNKNDDVLDIFNLNKHPFIFVSKGGHGCYPTPGYSVRGLGPIKLPIAFEERDIGKTCFIPKSSRELGASEKSIKTLLKQSSIRTNKLKFIEYEIIDFDSEPWSKYRGYWGNRSELKTWDSPVSAPNKNKFKINKSKFKNKFGQDYHTGQYTELIFHNYHGLLEK